MERIILPTPAEVAAAAVERFVAVTRAAVARRAVARVALSGGSTPTALYRLLTQPPWRERVPWDRLHIFWSDERCLPPDEPASNYRMARLTLLDQVPVPEAHVYRMPGELPPAVGAAAYQHTLAAAFGLEGSTQPPAWPGFDLILLGMGEDGHIASLFPGHRLLAASKAWVAYLDDSPKPPAERLTLTLPVLNAARQVLFLVTGEGKAGALKQVWTSPSAPDFEGSLPAARVQAPAGQVVWLVDEAAARDVPKTARQ